MVSWFVKAFFIVLLGIISVCCPLLAYSLFIPGGLWGFPRAYMVHPRTVAVVKEQDDGPDPGRRRIPGRNIKIPFLSFRKSPGKPGWYKLRTIKRFSAFAPY
jgi:hypothetical protein